MELFWLAVRGAASARPDLRERLDGWGDAAGHPHHDRAGDRDAGASSWRRAAPLPPPAYNRGDPARRDLSHAPERRRQSRRPDRSPCRGASRCARAEVCPVDLRLTSRSSSRCMTSVRACRSWSKRSGARSAPGGGGHMRSSRWTTARRTGRSEEHTSELQSRLHLVCRLLLEKKKKNKRYNTAHKGSEGSS